DIADQREFASDDGCKVPVQDEGCTLVRELAAFDEGVAGTDDDGRLHREISEEEDVREEADRSIRETAGAIPAADHGATVSFQAEVDELTAAAHETVRDDAEV